MNKKEGWKRITQVLAVITFLIIVANFYPGGILNMTRDEAINSTILSAIFIVPMWVIWYIIDGFIKD